jgi:hypothetical protein
LGLGIYLLLRWPQSINSECLLSVYFLMISLPTTALQA